MTSVQFCLHVEGRWTSSDGSANGGVRDEWVLRLVCARSRVIDVPSVRNGVVDLDSPHQRAFSLCLDCGECDCVEGVGRGGASLCHHILVVILRWGERELVPPALVICVHREGIVQLDVVPEWVLGVEVGDLDHEFIGLEGFAPNGLVGCFVPKINSELEVA